MIVVQSGFRKEIIVLLKVGTTVGNPGVGINHLLLILSIIYILSGLVCGQTSKCWKTILLVFVWIRNPSHQIFGQGVNVDNSLSCTLSLALHCLSNQIGQKSYFDAIFEQFILPKDRWNYMEQIMRVAIQENCTWGQFLYGSENIDGWYIGHLDGKRYTGHLDG